VREDEYDHIRRKQSVKIYGTNRIGIHCNRIVTSKMQKGDYHKVEVARIMKYFFLSQQSALLRKD